MHLKEILLGKKENWRRLIFRGWSRASPPSLTTLGKLMTRTWCVKSNSLWNMYVSSSFSAGCLRSSPRPPTRRRYWLERLPTTCFLFFSFLFSLRAAVWETRENWRLGFSIICRPPTAVAPLVLRPRLVSVPLLFIFSLKSSVVRTRFAAVRSNSMEPVFIYFPTVWAAQGLNKGKFFISFWTRREIFYLATGADLWTRVKVC